MTEGNHGKVHRVVPHDTEDKNHRHSSLKKEIPLVEYRDTELCGLILFRVHVYNSVNEEYRRVKHTLYDMSIK